MKEKDRFTLEHQIMQAWQIKEDLELIYHSTDNCTEDELHNSLLGLIQIADWKFQQVWDTFEELVHKGKIT